MKRRQAAGCWRSAARKRSPLFPDVPTLDEVGLKGFDADTVFGFYAPAGTPAEVVARLNAEINRVLALPAVRERIARARRRGRADHAGRSSHERALADQRASARSSTSARSAPN